MRNWQSFALFLIGFLSIFGAYPVHGQSPNDWEFSLPVSNISGSAGSTIGWGYGFVNNSPTDWLFVTDISSDSDFLHGTSTTTPFDYPVLMPNSSVMENYSGISGLADLAWDSDAPIGFVNSGNFIATAYFYDGDPFVGGNLIGPAGTHEASYNATVTSPVPEVSTITSFGLLLTLGLGRLLVSGYRRKAQFR